MTNKHFEVPETCSGFIKEARRIINRRRGLAFLLLGNEQYVLAFWWGIAGPTFCVLVEERQRSLADEELKSWLRKSKSQFGRFGFNFQIRTPRNIELAIKELTSAFI
jgi:hypothetical protein